MPITLAELRYRAEQSRLAAEQSLNDADAAMKRVLDRAKNAGDESLTPEQDTRLDKLGHQKRQAKAALARAETELDTVRQLEGEQAEDVRLAAEVHPTAAARNKPGYAVHRVGREERTYHPGVDRDMGGKPGTAFLLDAGRAFLGDPGAVERLARHSREEETERPWVQQRAVPSGNFSGLVVPQYLTDMYAPAVAAMRPFADVCNPHDLPAVGMTVNISRITTATAAGLQTTENTAVATADIDDTLLTENVQTVAGSVIVSRQAIDRGLLTEEVTTSDLLKRYASALDSTLLNQASTGLSAVSTSQTYTNAAVDTTAIPAFWKQLIQAQNTVEGVLLAQAPPSHFIMAPRRWNWATAAVSSSWPVVAGTNVPPQSWAVQLTNEYGRAVRAVLPNGMRITVDANVSTACLGTALTGGTQDQVYAVAAEECHLWEDPNAAVLLRCEQPSAANLGILFVAFGYFAYSMRRYPGASVVVNGTGLATPSFA